jgi:serine/threonine protein kinase
VTSDARFCVACGSALAGTEPSATGARPAHASAEALDAASSGFIGREVAGRYRILAKLGEGGMGSVYRAEQISLKRIVALKVLRPELSAEPGMVRRFNAEAELAAKLSHPNTVTLFDFGQDADGALFIAMEYLEGRSLREVLMRDGPLEAGRVLAICEQLCASLGDAHQRGIVHRDLKPDNVMLVQRGRQADVVRVLDFGIAKLRDEGNVTARPMTRAGDLIGTPQYMAPEQIRGEKVDARTDVYALGAMLYEMVTGRLPFEAPSLMAILSKHLAEMPVPPRERRPDLHIAPGLDQLIMDALQKEPHMRPPTMEAFADRLARLVTEVGARNERPPTGPPLSGGGYPSPPALRDSPPPGVPLLRTPVPGSFLPVGAAPEGAYAWSPQGAGPYSSPAPHAHAPHAHAPAGHPSPPPGPYAAPGSYPPVAFAAGAAVPSPAPVRDGYRPGLVPPPGPQPGRRGLWIGLGLCAAAAGAGVAVFFAMRNGGPDTPLVSQAPAPHADPVQTGPTGTVVPDFTIQPERQLYGDAPPATPGQPPVDDHGQPGVGVWEGGWWRDSTGALELDIPRGFSIGASGISGAAMFAGDCGGTPCTILTVGTSTYGLEVNDDMIAQIIAQLPMKLGQTGRASTVRVHGRDRYAVVVDNDAEGMRGQLVVLHGGGNLAMVLIQAPSAGFDHTAGFRKSFFDKRVRFRGP